MNSTLSSPKERRGTSAVSTSNAAKFSTMPNTRENKTLTSECHIFFVDRTKIFPVRFVEKKRHISSTLSVVLGCSSRFLSRRQLWTLGLRLGYHGKYIRFGLGFLASLGGGFRTLCSFFGPFPFPLLCRSSSSLSCYRFSSLPLRLLVILGFGGLGGLLCNLSGGPRTGRLRG